MGSLIYPPGKSMIFQKEKETEKIELVAGPADLLTPTRNLIAIEGEVNNKSFEWLSQMRFYFDPKQPDVLQQLTINISNAQFYYGFEYLGVAEKLV